MTQDLAKAINDGLYFYEEDLWVGDEDCDEGWIDSSKHAGTPSPMSENKIGERVNLISQEDFDKIRPEKKDTKAVKQRIPAPPPIETKTCEQTAVVEAASSNHATYSEPTSNSLDDIEFMVGVHIPFC